MRNISLLRSDSGIQRQYIVLTNSQDLALAHLRAVTKPEIKNRRVIIAAGSVTSQEIADILRSTIPELAERTPVGKPGEDIFPIDGYSVDTDPATDILGLEFRRKEETFLQLARQLLEIAKRTENKSKE